MVDCVKRYRIFLFFSFFLVFALFNFVSSNELIQTKSKISRCVTCHTITGNSSVGMWPKIAEQHSDYMLKQLIEFKKGKSGDRFDPTMFGMLQGLSEEELLEFINHYSSQKVVKSDVKFDAELFNTGKKLYLFGDKDKGISGCVGCHGIDGMGNSSAKYPVLKWQHKEYIIIQMNKFKSKTRSNDINSIMRDISDKMTSDQIDAVATYITNMK